MASLRHEGSSKFGKDHKWGNFPGISLGWRINRENFMKNVNWMDNLKLRVGYGVTGINVADPYTSLSSLNYNGAFLYNGTWVKALETIRNNNADLRWEKKHEFNVGLDWDVLGDDWVEPLTTIYVEQKMLFGTTRFLFRLICIQPC